MQTSKIYPVNYITIGLLGLVLCWVIVVTALARVNARQLQTTEGAPVIVSQPIVKPLPPALHAEFQAAQDQIETLQARLNAAALRQQNVLYRAALDLGMSREQAETCEVKQVVKDKAGPVWSFICPAPEPVQTPAPTPTPTATPKKQ